MVVKKGKKWTEDIYRQDEKAYITPMLDEDKNYRLDNVLCTRNGIAIFVLEEVEYID